MFNVTSLLDNGGANTFRAAIQAANAAPNSTITFAIGAQGTTQTITLNAALGALPALTAPTLIDGFSQNGGTKGTYIELNGNQIGATGLTVNAGGVEIRGLAVDNFNGDGIDLNNPLGSATVRVWRCMIGTDCTGVKAGVGNTATGIAVTAANDVIGAPSQADGNVISGNGANGVMLNGPPANNDSVLGNYIGVDLTGTKALANAGQGVLVQMGASNNVIGGDTAGHSIGSGNVIAGNGGSGIYVSAANSNQIVDNYIGLGSDGTTAVANASDGVGLWNGSSNNIIGGEDGFSGNYISGNGRNGVLLGYLHYDPC